VPDIGVKANAIRVCPASDVTDGTYIGDIKFGEAEPNSAAILADTTAILADTAAIQTAVELLDNAVDGNYLNVNLNAAGTDLSMNAGVLTAQTQRVTIATDDEVNNLLGTIDADTSSMATDLGTIAGDTTSIDGKITACNTGAVVLAAGSAAFGKLAANSGVDIGDVDVTSMPANTTASGTLTAAAQTVTVTPPNGCSAVSLQVTGTWVGQVEFEGTIDGTNYQSVEASNGTQTVNATTTNDIFLLPGAGYLTIRARASSWTSGTANITFIATIGATSAILTGSIPAGTNAIGKLAANSGVDIGDVDVTSVVPGTGATNLGKAIDTATGATDTGVLLLATRDDTLSALTPAEGDNVQLRVSSTGALHVTGGGGGTQYNIDDVLGATDTVTLAGVVRDDSLTTLTEADGDVSVLRVSSTGALHVTGGGGGTEYTEDVATANPIVGTATVMERDDALSTLTPIEGDWAAFRCSAEGALWVQDFNSDAILADTTTIIGHVDGIEGLLTTIDSDTSTLAVVGGGTEATALRVTIANDSTGVLSVDDGGGALTVDGTVTANLSATDNAVLDTIDAVLDTINAKLVTGTVIGDVNLGATDNAVLDDIAARVTSAETALQIIDDWDAVHDSAASSDGPQLMAAYDSTKPTAVGDGDAVRVLADASGRLLAGVEPERFQATITSADAQAATQVKAKTAAKQMHILSLIISTDTAMNIQLQDDAGTPVVLMEQIYLAANGGMALTFPPEAPLVVATNQDLDVITSAAGNISVTVTGYLMS
jgi:hypothetical protein